jgi:predicted RNA binding protein YcfA (HicA-like mRNA interferase family)
VDNSIFCSYLKCDIDIVVNSKAKLLVWINMPKKIRELKQILRKSGFTERPGKGSHTNWTHPDYCGKVTISGRDGSDAKRFLRQFLQRVKHPQRTVALS